MTATTPEDAQVSLDRFWSTTGDARLRPPGRYAEPGTEALFCLTDLCGLSLDDAIDSAVRTATTLTACAETR